MENKQSINLKEEQILQNDHIAKETIDKLYSYIDSKKDLDKPKIIKDLDRISIIQEKLKNSYERMLSNEELDILRANNTTPSKVKRDKQSFFSYIKSWFTDKPIENKENSGLTLKGEQAYRGIRAMARDITLNDEKNIHKVLEERKKDIEIQIRENTKAENIEKITKLFDERVVPLMLEIRKRNSKYFGLDYAIHQFHVGDYSSEEYIEFKPYRLFLRDTHFDELVKDFNKGNLSAFDIYSEFGDNENDKKFKEILVYKITENLTDGYEFFKLWVRKAEELVLAK